MAQLVASFLYLLGQWLESRGLGVVAGDCYRLAGNTGGKRGAKALWRLGKILVTNGQLRDALTVYQKSVQYDSANAGAWCDLGVAYRQSTRFDDARDCYDRALAIDPQNSVALTNIGELYLAQGNAASALDYFQRVLTRVPLFFEAVVNRIAALIECDKLNEAETAARNAIEHYPERAEFRVALGFVLERSGNTQLALVTYHEALEIDPNNQEALFHQAILLNDQQVLGNAVEFIRRRIELKGESAYLLGLLATALHQDGQTAEAEIVGHALLESHPAHAPGWKVLAQCSHSKGDAGAAVEYYHKAWELLPQWKEMLSCVAFCSTYLPDQTSASIFKIHLDWADRYEASLLTKTHAHITPPGNDDKKRLKIGYISGDLFNHPVGFLLRSVMQQHNHEKFEIHCFSTRTGNDSDYTATILRTNSDYWHDVQLLSVDELAELILTRGIDILVDLSGHTAHNRLDVFAFRPAPVQATWLGYFHSTGLTSIDYFISDRYTTPQSHGQFFTESPVRLPHSRFCYTPFDFAPEVTEAPFVQTGYITFGSFNRLAKLSSSVINAWSRIVLQVPAAKLLIKDKGLGDEETAKRLTNEFAARGLVAERLILRSASDYLQMYKEYSDIDIALDPFPFNGGMTTLEALWMGVPVVALDGISVVSRQSTSMLSNLGLDELIFTDVESYIAGASALALDTNRLANLRGIIRPRMSRSPLCDAEQFTSDLETLYRRMWQAWCRGEKLGLEIVPGPPVARKIVASTPVARQIVPSTPVARKIVPSIVEARKEPSADVSRKTVLHIGCGQANIHQLPVYFHTQWQEIRLDIDPDAHPDIVGTVLDMSAVLSNSVDAVYSSHMLEHLYAHELVIALAEIMRVLKRDGILVVTVPDLQTVAQLIVDDRLLDTAYVSPAGPITPFDMVYGHRGFIENGMVYMAHRGGFTLSTLIDAIRRAGFEAVTGNRRKSNYDLWVLATPGPITNDQLNQLSAQVLP